MISISTIEQLQLIGNDEAYPLDGDYVQTQDIDASDTTTWNAGLGFEPIGLSSYSEFVGTYDGGGFDILNLFIDRTDGQEALFYAAYGATICNVNIVNCNISGDYWAAALIADCENGTVVTDCTSSGSVSSSDGGCGGLIGYCEVSTITGCSSSVSLQTATGYTGGLIGTASSGCAITGCHATGNVTDSSNSYGTVGGFIGWVDESVVTNCYSTGNVEGYYYVGGFCGYEDGSISLCYSTGAVRETGAGSAGGFAGLSETSISKCYSTGEVVGDQDEIGGFVGRCTAATIVQDCYASGNVTGRNEVGGFVGQIWADYPSIINCYSTGFVTGNADVGGFAGNSTGTPTITYCYWDTETSGQATSDGGTGKTTAQMKQQATFVDWDFATPDWYILENSTYPSLSAFPTFEPMSADFSASPSEGASRLDVVFTDASTISDVITETGTAPDTITETGYAFTTISETGY